MNINKENYEEYFLLYADNELSTAERQEVEAFVKENVHLQKELEDILATIQQPEPTFLSDKSFLFKHDSDFITESNYEEKFVEYLDGELNEEERKLTEDYLAKNEISRAEFESIRRARLEPDLQITYPDKNALYRKPARVFYLNIVKIAVAAALTGAILWTGINQFRNSSTIEPQLAASSGTPATQEQNQTRNQDKTDLPSIESGRSESNVHHSTENKKENSLQIADLTVEHKPEMPVNSGKEENHPIQVALAEKPEPAEEASKINVPLPAVVPDTETAVTEAPSMAITASAIQETEPTFTYFEDEPQPNDYVFYDIPADKLRNSKLGVFIKKVKRTIDRGNPINRFLNGDDTD